MSFNSIIFRLAIIIIKLILPFVAIFRRTESLVLLLLHRPTAISFRMFPPPHYSWASRLVGFDVYGLYASYAWTILLGVPYMACNNRHHPGGLLSMLTKVLWERSRLAALLLCLMRLWLFFSVWNYTLLRDLDNAIAQGFDSMPKSLASRHPVLIFASYLWLMT